MSSGFGPLSSMHPVSLSFLPIPTLLFADMLECSWLDLLMKERNMERYTLANKDHDLMLGLDLMTAKNPDVDVYAVIAKHSHEAFAIRSLHSGRAWGGLMKLLKQPFFSDLKKETYTHWPKRWKMYQVGTCFV